ncbi:DUF4382 domain-containing protein [Mucilaginibacter sp. McL0603]|uniref:DUF4382 domain-containing protein n=1 Tax=Mucilaginibacter sp. McL0603 TaxID=3415670 RepID=UPI003CEB82CB
MKIYSLLFALIFCFAIASCNKDNSSTGSTHVSVKMTDAPGAYDAVILSVKSVVVVTDKGEQTIAVGGGPINILNFRLGKDTLLAAQDIPAGKIQQIRLVLNDSGNQVVVNGTTYNLTTPSGQTSGVKLNVHDQLVAGIDYTLRLDFDAAQSIVLTGNGKYNLKPVIRAIPVAASGALTGLVTPAASSPKVYAIVGTDTVGTTTDATGKFYFPGLAAGTYTVNFVPVSPYLTKTVSNVTVTTGAVQDMGTVTITQ